MPAISVIIPIYNCEKYIGRCINSVLSQSFTDYELILVNDGSKDSSPQICDKYAKSDNRIKVIHQKNSGVSAARNNGVKKATGEYVTFIDADDWVAPNFLETLITACKNNNAQIAICGYVTAASESDKALQSDEFTIMNSREAIDYYGDLNLNKKSAHFRSPWAKLIRREYALNVPFPTDRTYAEDGACVYLWLWQAERIVDLSVQLYYYFQNADSICRQPMGKHIVGNLMTESEWITFFKNNNFDSLYTKFCRRYLDDCLWSINGSREAGDKDAERIFIKYLRKGLMKYAKPAHMNLKRDTYYYELAYPNLIKIYYLFNR